MKKLAGESLNIMEENLAAMQQLFPEAFEEGKIDFDVLRQLLGDYVDDEEERYSFRWNGKGKTLRLSQTPSTGTLRPCKEESKDWNTTENLYIEGDNLEVLKLLQKSYHGKVKMIYIDPPYNTGKDFVYKDDFRDNVANYKRITGQVDDEGRSTGTNSESNGRFHTDWLNMMYPRLRLARNLLSDDGVIFISIDDNEQDNAIKLCHEIFGENNHLGCLTWIKKTKPINSGDAKYQLQSKVEYVHVYCKGKNASTTYKFVLASKGKRTYDFPTEKGFCRLKDIEDSDYGMKARNTMKFPILGMIPAEGKRWKIGLEESNRLLANDRIRMIDGKIKVLVYPEDEAGDILEPFWSWLDDRVGTAENGKKELNEILEKNIGFDTVKPKDLIVEILKHVGNDVIVLDFFSGSATTAHAVMQLNAEDGGNRRFILVQLPETTPVDSEAHKAGYENICEIGKERICRAGEKVKAECEDAERAASLDIGFKVFKLDSSNLQKWQPQPEDLFASLQESMDNFLPGRTELDVVYEIALKLGLDLSYEVEEREVDGQTVYIIGAGALMICLASPISMETAEALLKLHEEYAPETWQVVFRDTGFLSDQEKTNIKETLKSAGLDEDAFISI
ncbi:site-specific DNA-methyltransferase [uncultured Selenomonas sp.]|uniref:site-specific DNA-methyltransferase n=1 Tax=uncultured Selenomonas sp. TaxID=159275 RepID=UPI0028E27962|nr:site-specific DNA-methyltransferase [uncultured Selenomonas sp.]